jgi:2-polyprenyl-6-methoxyphenol hydroxylase-like FAD-dependent oxidoreductase
MSTVRHAEIAGAGIGGLSTAVFLAQQGWSVTVHEQDPQVAEVGAGLLLKPNSLTALEQAGVLDLLLGNDPPSQIVDSVFKDRFGRTVATYPHHHAGTHPFYCPLRQEVADALRNRALQLGADLRTSSPVVRAYADGVLELESGERRSADLVVGADGWRSRVRHNLQMGIKVSQLGHGASRVVVPRIASDPRSAYEEYWSGRRRIGLTPLRGDHTYVFFSCPSTDARGSAVPLDIDYYREAFPVFGDEFFDRITEGDLVWHLYSHVQVRQWVKGRVVLVGDSANGLPPTLAQGAGLAIMNAAGLALALSSSDDQESALSQWEARYRPLTQATQRWSMRYLRANNSWVSRRVAYQSTLLRLTRFPAVNRRMRMADRCTASTSGPQVIA